MPIDPIDPIQTALTKEWLDYHYQRCLKSVSIYFIATAFCYLLFIFDKGKASIDIFCTLLLVVSTKDLIWVLSVPLLCEAGQFGNFALKFIVPLLYHLEDVCSMNTLLLGKRG